MRCLESYQHLRAPSGLASKPAILNGGLLSEGRRHRARAGALAGIPSTGASSGGAGTVRDDGIIARLRDLVSEDGVLQGRASDQVALELEAARLKLLVRTAELVPWWRSSSWTAAAIDGGPSATPSGV